jgi:hypothetical protein
MSDLRRPAGKVIAALLGGTVGAAIVFAVGDFTTPGPRRQVPNVARMPATAPELIEDRLEPESIVLLAWTPGSLPVRAEDRVERIPGVDQATTLVAGLDWIAGSSTSHGGLIGQPPPGFKIPFETVVIEPQEYASFVAPGERDAIAALRQGEALLSRTSAELRGGDRLSLALQGPGERFLRSVRTVGVVSDEAAQGYEALLAGPVPATWERADRFILVRVGRLSVRSTIERTLRSMLGGAEPIRVRAYGETPFLRYGDAVLPQMIIKEAFGEFAARPMLGGSIEIDPQWRQENIATSQLPLIGRATCHRFLLPQLRQALRAVRSAGAADKIDPGQFAGCYNARFIARDPAGRLSHHSWGIAVDFNALENPSGANPRLDREVVDILERHGFTWGGRWLVPDGMHFEWVRFP